MNGKFTVTPENCTDTTTTPEFKVIVLKNKHQENWRDKPESYWLNGLQEEVYELAGALRGEHEHPADFELMQIAAICINWLEMRAEKQ